MRTLMIPSLVVAIAVASSACGPQAGSLQAAERRHSAQRGEVDRILGNRKLVPVRPGAGPNSAVAAVRRQQLHGERQLRHAGGARADDAHADGRAGSRPAGSGRAGPDQYVSGTTAWNWPPPAGAAPDPPPAAQPQPAAVEERMMEIWTTPHGFLKAAAANNATSQPSNGGSEVSFTVDGKHKYVGTHQRAEPSRARPDVDRQHRARRHAGRDHLLRLPRLRRRDVPGANRRGRRAAIRCSTSPSRR